MLEDRNILIAGGTLGIGFAITERFHARGANIVVASNDKFESSNQASQALSLPSGVQWLYVDLALEDSPESMVAQARAHFGSPIDVLVYVAGVYLADDLTSSDLAEVWNRNYFVKARGSYLAAIAFANQLEDSSVDPCMLFVSSINALQSEPNHMAYDGACAAVEGQTRSLAVHLAPRVRVNCIAPGLVNTRLTQEVMQDPSALAYAQHCIPQARVGEPSDYQGPAEFLCDSELSAYMTGEVMRVDGGIQAQQAPPQKQ